MTTHLHALCGALHDALRLVPRSSLRALACVASYAALIGCGAAAGSSGSTVHAAGDVRTLACGTYTHIEPSVVEHDGELATVPFVEIVLGDADPCSPLPLIVALHGLGDRPSVPRWPYRDLPVAVRVVMPRGPIPWGSGYAWSSVRVLDHDPTGLSATIDVQADRIAAFLDALVVDREVRGGVVLAGFSQGGILALSVLMRHPRDLGLVIPMSAWVPEAVRTAAPPSAPPIRWMHGIADERVPYDMALDAATDLRARGYDLELIGYPDQRHAMSMAMDVRFHSWLVQALTNLQAGRPLAEGFVLEP